MTTGTDAAFPRVETVGSTPYAGLNKREWMATVILSGWFGGPRSKQNVSVSESAIAAVAAADSLITALNA